MDEEGYTKLSDLGLAQKVRSSGVSGVCGTRGYWAPDMLRYHYHHHHPTIIIVIIIIVIVIIIIIIRRGADGKRQKYTLSVDWFSLGCVVYEFLFGV